MYNYKDPVTAKGESCFKVHLNFFVNESFREDKLKHFVLAHSRIRRCIRVNNTYDYCIIAHLRYKNDFEEFYQELLHSVPGIEHTNIGVINSVLKP